MGLPTPYYQDSQTQIFCGDALELLPCIETGSINLILTDPPYFKTKLDYLGEKITWDRQWKTAEAYLDWLRVMAKEWKRILSVNGSVYCFASPQMAAQVEVMLGEVFHVIQRLTWRKPPYSTKAEMFKKDALRMFFPASEAIVFAEQSHSDPMALRESGYQRHIGDLHCQVFGRIFGNYLQAEFQRAGITNREIATLFPSQTGGLTGCVSNWILGHNCPSKDQYHRIRDYLNAKTSEDVYLRQEYEDLRQEYEDLRQEYEDLRQEYVYLRQEYEDLRRPFFATKDRCYTDVLDYATVSAGIDKHPCEKPLPLLRDLILTSSRPGDLVLDSCAGSFATCEAARDCGRRSIGIERDARWCRRGKERLAQQVLWQEVI